MYYFKVEATYRISGRENEEDYVEYEIAFCRGIKAALDCANSLFSKMLQKNILDEFTGIRIEKGKFINNVFCY